MANFHFENTQDNQIVRLKKDEPLEEKIFEKYVRLTLENIDQSLADAKDRYKEGKTNASAKTSQNWKVVKKSGKLIDEEVKVWLKIGSKKQALFINQKGVEVLEVKISASQLVEQLLEFKQAIEFVRDNPSTGIAQEFHQEAIGQATPKSMSSTEGKTRWKYDPRTDLYVAI